MFPWTFHTLKFPSINVVEEVYKRIMFRMFDERDGMNLALEPSFVVPVKPRFCIVKMFENDGSHLEH